MPDSVQTPPHFAREARGHPLHTRMLEIELRQGAPGKFDVRGTILDLRKQGFIPAGADLQVSGIIHHMEIRASIDGASRVIEKLESSPPVVAFEASGATAGESCRDIADRLGGLVGKVLDARFAQVLSEIFGGPRGCSHLLTLAHVIGSSVPHALAWEEELMGVSEAIRERGERLFKRSLFLDGMESDAGRKLDVVVQSNDIHSLPAAKVVSPVDRFLRQHEVRLLVGIDLESMTVVSAGGEERERNAANLVADGWQSRDSELAALEGKPALHGLAREVLANFSGTFPATPLRDALLFIAPGVIQCLAANAQRLLESAGRSSDDAPAIAHVGGMPDSCYLWRRGGPGQGQGGLWDNED